VEEVVSHIRTLEGSAFAFPSDFTNFESGRAYAGNKAAIEQCAFALTKELVHRKIMVNPVLPALMNTGSLDCPNR
jgi:NAD(P)-dependent dehydrogenase (short-subunit alcohol dehydrogenase family)